LARPSRCRKICVEPLYNSFQPREASDNGKVVLTLDEFEAIRLIDFEKKTHQQCAECMEVSRTTVSEIYEKARFKIADCIINGKALFIKGGNYRVCDGSAGLCFGKKCPKYKTDIFKINHKGENLMKIAVAYDNGNVFQHFGHTEQFKIYDVSDDKIVNTQIADTLGNGHGAIAGFLSELNVDVLICGGIGNGAKEALADMGIKLFGGVSGNADKAVEDFIFNRLVYNSDISCSHHNSGEHQCGENKHGCAGKGGC